MICPEGLIPSLHFEAPRPQRIGGFRFGSFETGQRMTDDGPEIGVRIRRTDVIVCDAVWMWFLVETGQRFCPKELRKIINYYWNIYYRNCGILTNRFMLDINLAIVKLIEDFFKYKYKIFAW